MLRRSPARAGARNAERKSRAFQRLGDNVRTDARYRMGTIGLAQPGRWLEAAAPPPPSASVVVDLSLPSPTHPVKLAGKTASGTRVETFIDCRIQCSSPSSHASSPLVRKGLHGYREEGTGTLIVTPAACDTTKNEISYCGKMSVSMEQSSSTCNWCGSQTSGGVICPTHQQSLHTGVPITAEQIQNPTVEQPAFHLIDCLGRPLGLAASSSVGRSSSDLVLLHHSISSQHAQIEKGENSATVTDLASLNGTFVNGQRIEGPTPLFDGDVVQFADLSFFYTEQTSFVVCRSPTQPGGTIRVEPVDVPFSARLIIDHKPTDLFEQPPGGVLRSGTRVVTLSKMEFSLLRVLADVVDQALSAETFLPSRAIAEALEFRSIDAGSENVRELVKRIRRKAKENGFETLIASRPRHGYRLATTVAN